MQNVAYGLEDMKSYFQKNETHNRFHEVQSSSLIDISFDMRENLCNARGKSKIRMQPILHIDMLKQCVLKLTSKL